MGRKRRRKTVITRTVGQRIKKWDAKVKGDIYAQIMKDVKPLALERFARYQPIHTYLIDVVRNVINQIGVGYEVTQEYMWYAQGLWYLIHRYRSKALQIEADARFLYFIYRGMNEEVLRTIAKVLGIKISSWEVILERLPVVLIRSYSFDHAIRDYTLDPKAETTIVSIRALGHVDIIWEGNGDGVFLIRVYVDGIMEEEFYTNESRIGTYAFDESFEVRLYNPLDVVATQKSMSHSIRGVTA